MGKYGWIASGVVLAAGVALNLDPEYIRWVDQQVYRANPMEGILALQLYVTAPIVAAYVIKRGVDSLENRIVTRVREGTRA